MRESNASLNPEPHREEALFQAASQLIPVERLAFLDAVCRGDPALRRRLDALLAAHDDPDSLLLSDPTGIKATVELAPPIVPDEAVGKTLGRYKLLEKIGEGGCGVVYVAEQIEPVRRRVALKVIKLGMDTRQVVARFEAERQALAMMDHPNIAKVLDAGTTETGRPYFVMELVRGIKITDYCDENHLTTKERLDLFIKVCHAIQHAHQKGIIHRDIKPSNILVTLHDGVPVPKVIDFGIAKATEGRLTEVTVYTQLHQFIGTPAYMSPEQAEMSGLDIDTRSDIYSLGVLLYELLAGSTPFDAEELMASGLEAMRKAIREKEPVRPSTRLATLKAEESTTTAKRRSTDTSKLLNQLKGDLDWIVMKCLEKDRTRRYETANGLSMDLKRHLDNEPVVARPPSTAYRFQKAFHRNKLVFGAATAIVVALVAGIAISTWQTVQARKAQRETEAARKSERQQRLEAQSSEQKARAQALAARRTAYSSDMNLVQQALAANNLGRAQALLNRQKPQSGQTDLRDWEWRYLWSQTRAEDHEVFFSGTDRLYHPLSFSADSRLLARELDGETVVTDLISHRTILQRTNAWLPVFAHHGSRLAFAGRVSSTPDDAIILLDTTTQTESHLATSWQHTQWVGFTPDDRRLLTVSVQPGAKWDDDLPWDLTAWEIDSGRQLWQRAIRHRNWPGGHHFSISPDGAAFAAVGPNGCVQVLETKDGSERFSIKTTEEDSISVIFSPDSSTLLSSAAFTDSTIRLWNARSGQADGSLVGHSSYVSDLLFTPEGTRLLSSSGDQTIRLWDWPSGRPAGVLRGHLDEIDGLALAPDGRTLASRCKDGSIYLWDVSEPTRHLGYQTLPRRLQASSALFTPDSQSILGAESSGGVALWNARTLKETRRLWGDSTNGIDVIFSPDASRVVRGDTNGRLYVWDVRSGLEITNFIAAPGEFAAWITDNGKFLVTRSGPDTNVVLETWDTDTWQRHGSLALHFTNIPNAFTTSLPNSYVMMADGAFHFFNLTKLNEAPKLIQSGGNLNDLTDLAVSPNGRLVAASYGTAIVRLWDMETLQPVETLKGFLLGSSAVGFSPDGRRLAATSAGREAVRLWDAQTREEVLTLSGEGSEFYGLKFSPDGRCLLAINNDGLAQLWSAPTWAEIAAAEAKEKAEIKQR